MTEASAPKKQPEETPEKKPEKMGFKYKLSTEIIVAILGLVGIGITAYFSYLQTTVPFRYESYKTQTAEARLTRIASEITSTATSKPILTSTHTPTKAATETATLTKTPTVVFTKTKKPTPMPTRTEKGRPEGLRYCINAYSVNVREGPSTNKPIVGNLRGEDCLFFDAANMDGDWLRISPNQPEEYVDLERGWVYIELLGLLENSRLPEITLTPTLTFTPTETFTPSPTLTPSLTPTPSPTITPTTAG